MTVDLPTWLRAQLDADAKAQQDPDDSWHDSGCASVPSRWRSETGACDCGIPAQALADVEAKRRAIGNHQADDKGCCRTCAHWTTGWVDGHQVDRLAYEGVRAPCLTLRLLGLSYADRAGYDESWRP